MDNTSSNHQEAPTPTPSEAMGHSTTATATANGQAQQQQHMGHSGSLVHGEGTTNASTNQLRQYTTGRSSPRMRYRGQQTSSSRSKAKSGRHNITNINRINVINNFGPTPPDPTKGKKHHSSASKNSLGAPFGCCILRSVIASLIVFWLVAMMIIMRGEELSELHMGIGGIRGGGGPAQHKAAAGRGSGNLATSLTSSLRTDEEDASNNPNDPNTASATTTADANETAHSIFELSMFHNNSPQDFQRTTPHAPSCPATPNDATSISFTLVSQLSHDRIWMVQYHCERWGPSNPMSIVVFTDRTAPDVKSELVRKGCSEDHLTVQTVGKTRYDPTGTEYPVNLLRNMAFSAVRTSHIVYADVDFWPSADLHDYLSAPAVLERFAADARLATVVPVFQMTRRCGGYEDCRDRNIPHMPKRKAKLMELISHKRASTFDPTNVGGHGSTKYTTWKDQEEGSFVDLRCIKSNRYEPYLAFRYCSDLPPFQEGFTGYGKNKMTWVMQLRRAGYLFSQLGGAFLVHYPHLDSKARLEWNRKPKQLEQMRPDKLQAKDLSDIDWGSFKRARVDALFLDFKEWLDQMVEDQSRTPMCSDSLNDDVRLWVHPGSKNEADDEVSSDEVDAAGADLDESEDEETAAANSGEATEEDPGDTEGVLEEGVDDAEGVIEGGADDAEATEGKFVEESTDAETMVA